MGLVGIGCWTGALAVFNPAAFRRAAKVAGSMLTVLLVPPTVAIGGGVGGGRKLPVAPPGVVIPLPPRCDGGGLPGGGLGVLGALVDDPGVSVDPKLMLELGVDDGVGVCVIVVLSFSLQSWFNQHRE